jgi:hypothetical protein
VWADGPGILVLADGRRVRGRGLRRSLPDGPEPEFGLYLLGHEPPVTAWPSRWLRWPDFRLPTDPVEAAEAFAELHARSATERVEVACGGGRGRTGTALACLCIVAGTPAEEAVDYVRSRYDPHAIETPWQRRYVRRFRPA